MEVTLFTATLSLGICYGGARSAAYQLGFWQSVKLQIHDLNHLLSAAGQRHMAHVGMSADVTALGIAHLQRTNA